MTGQVLREAAALMRSRAEALDGRRWSWTGAGADYPQYVSTITASGSAALVAETYGGPDHPAWEAEHIAAASPAFTLTVADWLDDHAETAEMFTAKEIPASAWSMNWQTSHDHALAVAAAYLASAR